MHEPPTTSPWTRHFVYREQHTRTTWKLRLGLVALVVGTLWLTSGWWTVTVARSLICEASLAPSDAILVENLDPDYLLFERATQLRRAGLSPRVLVPIWTDLGTPDLDEVALGTVQVMARIARIGTFEIVPTRQVEPITLNAARDVERFLEREHIRSVIIVTPLSRSRRSALIYAATFARAGITVHCQAVPATGGLDHWARNWTRSWHGIQDVAAQWLKLQYYRFYVFPLASNPTRSSAGGS